MENPGIVAFDCDGVMFDTTEANRAFYNRILAEVGRPPMSDSDFAYCHMHTADESISFLFPGEGEAARAHEVRKRTGYGPFYPMMKMEPDLVGLLKRLRTTYKTAVATNRSDTMARVVAEFGLADLFDIIVTSLDVVNPKPAPDPLLRILDHFGAAPKEMIFIGDSLLDELSARAAGVPFAAFRNPSLTADWHIHRLSEVEAILNGRKNQ